MVNWKDFKNWLDKNIVETDGLAVKFKSDKQNEYGEIQQKILTDFYDSLKATLDRNASFYLLPALSRNWEFRELFFIDSCWFGKKNVWRAVKIRDYQVLENLFNDWKKKEVCGLWHEIQYKKVDGILGRSKWGPYYVDTDGYVYNNLSIASRIEQRDSEINWLKEQLKKTLGEKYEAQIEANYPYEFL